MILIISKGFTTGVIFEKGDCLYALIGKFYSFYFSNLSANSFMVNVLITGLPFNARLGIWQAKS